MNHWRKKITNNRIILLIIALYFFLHLTNLTMLPIFNDEAIYLDWAWSYTHMPGHLYDSLLDAKQPLMIWIFAFFENIFSDPLFAGRFTSVLIGSITALGIYTVTKKLINKNAAIIASLLYSIIPIFVFYNRQALMEAGVACIGVWAFYALLNLIDKPTSRNGVILGAILGLGFFIKTSSLLFILAATFAIFLNIFNKKQAELIKPYLISVITFFGVNFLLFINPIFWQTFSTNSRYSYSLTEIFTFPFASWLSHLVGFFEIGFIFITPLVFLCGIIGIFLMSKAKVKYIQIFSVYFSLALFLEIFSGKFQSQRYLVGFLPFLIISASYVFSILWQGKILKKSIVVISFLIPLISSIILVINPEYHIMQLSKISTYSEVAYVRGQTSGYGINETMEYIKEHSKQSQPTLVLFGLNAGNPENAVDLYSQKDPQLYALRIDYQFFSGIEQYKCLTSQYPTFFITRNAQLAGMDHYFELEKSFINPDKEYSVGIYVLKKDCDGKAASLSDFYLGAMNRIQELRLGL